MDGSFDYTKLARIDEGRLEWLLDSRGGMKFVLVEGPKKEGYVRFGMISLSHHAAFGIFFDHEIPEELYGSELHRSFQPKGGGFVEVTPLETKHKLRFYGVSDEYGKADVELLRKTLGECLSDKFSYRVD